MAQCSGRNRAAVVFAALSASGGAFLAFYICKRVRELRSQKFPDRIANAISNEHLAVLAKSSNVSLRQSAEQMLLDRILEKGSFQEVISGCSSRDENELYRACSVLCVVLKSVNFSIPLPIGQVSHLLTSCLQKSLDRQDHFDVLSKDSVFPVKIQRMTLATICDFMSDSVPNKDVLIGTCPDIISTCIRLVNESSNKEVLRYSVLLLFQFAGLNTFVEGCPLGTTRSVRESGAVPALAKRIITFHREHIMQRITLQTIVILIGSVDDSKPFCSEIATPMVLMPTISSCSSDDVELSFWALALIQDFVIHDLCTDEMTSMSHLVKDFLEILKTREGVFKSFVLKIMSALCLRRVAFLEELSDNKPFLITVCTALKDQNDLVINYAIRFLKVMLQHGPGIIKKLLDLEDNVLLDGLCHVSKEGQKENKLLLTELLTDLVSVEKLVLQIVQGGVMEIVKELARDEDDESLTFFSSAMLMDMAMVSDEIKVEMNNCCVLPTIFRWIQSAKSEKVSVFGAKALVMFHLIDDSMNFTVRSDGHMTHISGSGVELIDSKNFPLKMFRVECLLSQNVCPLCIKIRTSPTSSSEGDVEFSIPALDALKTDNAGDVIIVTISGKCGAQYVRGLSKYINLSIGESDQLSGLAEGDVGVVIAIVGDDGRINTLKVVTATTEVTAEVAIPYMTLFSHRTTKHILPEILAPLSETSEQLQLCCPLERRELEVLKVLLCLEGYMDSFTQSPTSVSNLLSAIVSFTDHSTEDEQRIIESVLGILTVMAVFDSGRDLLISLDTHDHLVAFLSILLETIQQSSESSSNNRNDVFEADQVAVPPNVAAIISSLPPRPQSRAEPRSSLRSSDSTDSAIEDRGRHTSSSISALPVIPEAGSEMAGGDGAGPVHLQSLSSLVDEVIASVTGEARDAAPINEGETLTEAILEAAVICLTKIVSREARNNSAQSRLLLTHLDESGTVLMLWSCLLTVRKKHRNLLLPLVTTMTTISETISLDTNDHHSSVGFDASNATRMLVLSNDHLEILNFNWTFESVRATVSISRDLISSSAPCQPKGWFYQMELVTDGLIQLGWVNDKCVYQPRKGNGVGDDYDSYSIDGIRKKKWHGPVATQTEGNGYGETWNAGDIVTCLFDRHGSISYLLNDKDLGIAFSGVDMDQRWFPACSVCTDQRARFNFGNDPIRFAESIPDGFVPIADASSDGSRHQQPHSKQQETSALEAERKDPEKEELSGVAGGACDRPNRRGERLPVQGAPIVPSSPPSLYFEVYVRPYTPRPLRVGFSIIDAKDRITVMISNNAIMLPDRSRKQLPVQPLAVVGCGYVAATHSVFFTIDGEVVELLFSFSHTTKSRPVTPCLSSRRTRVNWGQEEFKYKMTDVEEYMNGAISHCQRSSSLCQPVRG